MQFERTENREGEGSLKPGKLLTRGTSREMRFSWNGRWRWGPTTTVRRVLSSSTVRILRSSLTIACLWGHPLCAGRPAARASTTFSVKYDLKPRSLPLFGKLKSNVTLNFEVGVSNEIRANGTGNEARTPITDQSTFKTQLSLTYKFSENFRERVISAGKTTTTS